ncbi:hypothetical protein E2C01_036355 [Portunus trituberculatus]|uniref:Uncharacterized protein n=1 Tax=Portunus trituberculatus TaxID=210409 RepID=A0A5B7FAY9_PORTR|nr:hypothetical protein [Portunus trituberculatus]
MKRQHVPSEHERVPHLSATTTATTTATPVFFSSPSIVPSHLFLFSYSEPLSSFKNHIRIFLIARAVSKAREDDWFSFQRRKVLII